MEDWINYITFDSDQMQVFYVSKEVDSLEFKVGESDWQPIGKRRVLFGGNRGKLSLRATNKKGTDGATFLFGTDANVVCIGDIRTLVDYLNYKNADTSEATFHNLFKNCKQLIFPPELYSSELAEGCFLSMFEGCSSLKAAPDLPAKKMADSCYHSMFKDCTSLERSPKLPAKKLTVLCYYSMFEGCKTLEVPPLLPAVHLDDYCYEYMFAQCI